MHLTTSEALVCDFCSLDQIRLVEISRYVQAESHCVHTFDSCIKTSPSELVPLERFDQRHSAVRHVLLCPAVKTCSAEGSASKHTVV